MPFTGNPACRASGFRLQPDSRLLHQLELAAVEAQQHVPAFAGNGLHPIGRMRLRRRRAEPYIDRDVGIDDDTFLLAADARELLIGLQLGARLFFLPD